MNLLRKYIRVLLVEATANDMLSEFETRGYAITIEDNGNQGFEIKLKDSVTPAKNYSTLGMISAAMGVHEGQCMDAYAITWVSVEEKGWGPFLYDLAMEYATLQGSGLTSDRETVSYQANKVWSYYLANRGDVEAVQMDDLEDRLTPDTGFDNCQQTLAYERGVEDGSFWDEFGDMEETPWDPYGKEVLEKSPLSKMYRWKGPANLAAIKAMGRWIEV